MPIKKLRVLPNPSHALDHEGDPACAVQFENASGDYWVGASIDHKKSLAEKRTVFVFDETTVVEVPCSGYYARKILDGELLAADLESARAAGIPDKDERLARFAKSEPAKSARRPAPTE